MAAGSASSPVETWSDSAPASQSGEVWKDAAQIKPPESHGAIGEFWSKLALAHPIETAGGLIHAVAHPLDTFEAISHQTGDLARKAQQSYREGDYGGAAAHAFNAALNVIPGLGAAIDEAATKGANGDWGGMVADAGALAANLATPKLLGKAGGVAGEAASLAGKGAKAAVRALPEVTPGMADMAGLVEPRIAHGLRILGRIQHAVGSAVKEAPAEVKPAAEASRIVLPESEESVQRPEWRQEIVSELNKKPGAVAEPANTVTSPETAEAAPQVSTRESANRTKLAQDLAEFLHSNGEGISHSDALRMGPDQWKLARSAVRQSGKAAVPSPATVQIALEHLKTLEESGKASAKVVPITSAPSAALKGSPTDTASWVIVDKATGKAVMETYLKKTADAVNLDKYKVVPIEDYLISINGKSGEAANLLHGKSLDLAKKLQTEMGQ